MISEALPGISALSPREKWILAGELWDIISDDPTAIPSSDEQREEIQNRWEEFKRNPEDGSTWEETKQRIGKS